MMIELSPLQARVIGVLIEKEITTPEQYPLSLNALTLGCNQKSSRDPVMTLSEYEVQTALDELRDKNLTFENVGSRVTKYKHRFCNTEFSTFKFSQQQLALICVLLLRGPQTAGELRTRTNRLAQFANVQEVESCLHTLGDFNTYELIVKLAREPGKRDCRYMHLFCGELGFATDDATEMHVSQAKYNPNESNEATLTQRIDDLETELQQLKREFHEMRTLLHDLGA